MKLGYEEFKLKVLQKVTTLYLKHHDHPPLFCFQGKEGQNKLLVMPPQIFQDKSYKEFLPGMLSDILVKTESKYSCYIMQCTVTEVNPENRDERLKETELGRKLLEKFKQYDKDGNTEPHLSAEEHHLLCEEMGEDRVVFIFQAKDEGNTMMSFIKEAEGKLKPSQTFEEEEGNPMGGVFGNLFK
jgi:hypothetical protein